MVGTHRRPTGVGRPGRLARWTLPGVVAAAGAIAAVLVGAATSLAASPSPTSAAVGDPRSSGQGPGLVGDPLTAIALVAAIALASLVATLVYVRLTRGPAESGPGR